MLTVITIVFKHENVWRFELALIETKISQRMHLNRCSSDQLSSRCMLFTSAALSCPALACRFRQKVLKLATVVFPKCPVSALLAPIPPTHHLN